MVSTDISFLPTQHHNGTKHSAAELYRINEILSFRVS